MHSHFYAGSGRALRMFTAIALIALAVAFDSPAFGQACVPVTNSPITTNGIVFGGFGAMGACVADQGWAGVVAKTFIASAGMPGLNDPQILITGYNAASDGTLDKIYVGVHVNVDQELDDFDKLLLVFDANGNGGASFDGNDFAILATVGSQPPPVDEQCNQNVGGVTFYQGAGLPQVGLPAGVQVKRSWDYANMPDPETEIWEAEFEIDVAGLGLTAPSAGAGFRFGARLIVVQSTNGTQIWRWPSTFPNDNFPSHFEPSTITGLTPATLSTTSFGNCADVAFEPDGISGVSAWNSNGDPNAFTRLNLASDFSGETPLKKNKFQAKVKFFNPSNLADNSAVGVANTGKVNFILKPWNNGFLATINAAESTVAFTHLNEIQTVNVEWPTSKSQYQPHAATFSASQHTCLEVRLSNFTVNLNEGSDFVQRNLVYLTASTIRDTFVISSEGMRLPSGQTEFQYLLRARWRNVPKEFADGWSFKIENADRLGLKDMKNGNFIIPIKPKERKLVALAITGGKMPVTPTEFAISPRAGGKLMPTPSGEDAKVIPVKPGKMITLISTGDILIDPKQEIPRSGADGYTDSTLRKRRFLLPADFYVPHQNVGALIGSFDGFKTAFVIGNALSFVVPEKAEQLWLAVNDMDGMYNDNRGKGFNVTMYMTDPYFLPTSVGARASGIAGVPAIAQGAANLPQLDIESFNMRPVKGERGLDMVLEPLGYVAVAIYQSHEEGKQDLPGKDTAGQDTTKPGGTSCSCSPSRSSGYLGLAPMLLLMGTAILYRRAKRRGRKDEV